MGEPAECLPHLLADRLSGLSASQLIALGVFCSGLGTLRRVTDRRQMFDNGDLWRFSNAVGDVLRWGRAPAVTLAAARQMLEDAVPGKGR